MSTEDLRAVFLGLVVGSGFIILAFASAVAVEKWQDRRDRRAQRV